MKAGTIFTAAKYEQLSRRKTLEYNSYFEEDTFEYETDSPSIGFTAAAGVELKVWKHLGLFGQVQLESFGGSAGFYTYTDPNIKNTNMEFKVKRMDTLFGFGLRIY